MDNSHNTKVSFQHREVPAGQTRIHAVHVDMRLWHYASRCFIACVLTAIMHPPYIVVLRYRR